MMQEQKVYIHDCGSRSKGDGPGVLTQTPSVDQLYIIVVSLVFVPHVFAKMVD